MSIQYTKRLIIVVAAAVATIGIDMLRRLCVSLVILIFLPFIGAGAVALTPSVNQPAAAVIFLPLISKAGSVTLLAEYRSGKTLTNYRYTYYRPRQFATNMVISDATWGNYTITSAGGYTGWDLLVTPNISIERVSDIANWQILTLNRSATVVIVWRGRTVPTWLASWTPAGSISVTGPFGAQTYQTFIRLFQAGEVILGGVYDPGQSGPAQDTYWVLLAEGDGTPTKPPVAPAGLAVPQPNETCPAWVHDQYVTTGPDGKIYPTWHPQVDPVYWCYFRHEHGSDPSLFLPNYQPAYDYVNAVAGMTEPHTGFKSYVFDDGAGYRWLVSHHFGTASIRRACNRFHSVDVAGMRLSTGELVADLHFMGDFGLSTANDDGPPLTPSACPNQAADAVGSTGIRQIPVQSRGFVAYEPWRLDTTGNILGVNGADFTINTPDVIAHCDTTNCDNPVVNPNNVGSTRFITVYSGFGVTAGPNVGVFYTDAMGHHLSDAGPNAVRQYVMTGLSAIVPASATLSTPDAWHGLYLEYSQVQTYPHNIEWALQSPN